MKFGKEFQHILQDSDFPDDWKSSAIEYRQLKKLIKDVVAELSSMGLSPDVLHKLLVTESSDQALLTGTRQASASATSAHIIKDKAADDDGDVLEFEFESDGSPVIGIGDPVSRSPTQVVLDPVLSFDGAADTPELSTSPPSRLPHHRFRLRLQSDASSAATTLVDSPASASRRPASVSDMMRTMSVSSTNADEAAGHRKVIKRAVGEDVTAEYVLAGDSDHPIPQLRLHVSHYTVPSSHVGLPASRSLSTPAELESSFESTDDDEEEEPMTLNSGEDASDTPQALRATTVVGVTPRSPSLVHVRAAASPIWAIATADDSAVGEMDLGESAIKEDEAAFRVDLQPASPRDEAHEVSRDFVIPLQSDLAFFNLLTAALTSLSTFHSAQQVAFRQSVARLCASISDSIQPGSSSVQVVPTPLTPSTPTPASSSSSLVKHVTMSTTKTSKRNLYAWREIFAMWIEAQIFESSSERDRGERSVEEAEKRLKAFANSIVKRGLGDRRTLRGKRHRDAWDEFLRLNVLLLDLKRFQVANVSAARKILKKHDKRTALTASTGFAAFVRSTLSAHVGKDGQISTWSFYSTSLPHVLLASLTETLLPLDDYACLICTSIAFKPIRLSCNHLFCVRCLVKMQRAGKDACPLCRSRTVLLADKHCLDYTVMEFMKEWFPKEVKEKQKENEAEVAKDTIEEAGLDTRCIIM